MFKVKKSAILLLFIFFITSRIAGGKIPYLIFNIIFLTFLLSFIWASYIKRKITVFQKYDDKDYYVDDYIEIKSIIDNDTLLPTPQIEVVDKTIKKFSKEEPTTFIFSLMPLCREFTFENFKLKYRGIYELGPLEIKITDVFGIFSWKYKIYSSVNLKVYPRVREINFFSLNSMQSYGTLNTLQKAYEDNTSISDIRKYNEGDNFKRIHYKVSAKKGELYIKNYDMTGSASAFIFLDFNSNCFLGENSKELEERAVESAASIAAYLLKKAVSLNLYVNSSNVYYTSIRDTKDIKSLLDILCEIKPAGKSEIRDLIEKRIKFIKKGSTLIIITGNITIKDVETYCYIKESGYDFIIIYVSDFIIERDLKERILTNGIIMYKISSNSDIKEALEKV
ncbi:Uncharacterized conserved protein, DUF58 family, contains vWF domain [Caloramator quimbayensis]|uniref:Uncharacterized conserved protein, DUF58 family, contains vWF domain n=1 Tax=Caloramator quimbayensis TaxID=1147123 RepID=A0A1T4XV24_9CLOT|nr:DUF58 domain-containing protein [Caloramator quimbayensis]SKA93429.1 Uncharacterized conserved protein, DUF58 family, contains vWF domain [Caloramator quimbayensis]